MARGQARRRHLVRRVALPRSSWSALVALFRARGVESVEEFEVVREDVRFMLPKKLRQDLAAATTA